MALCLGTCGDPRGGGVSYERGTPVDSTHTGLFEEGEQMVYFPGVHDDYQVQGYFAHKKHPPP